MITEKKPITQGLFKYQVIAVLGFWAYYELSIASFEYNA